jgi:hypothetical protein
MPKSEVDAMVSFYWSMNSTSISELRPLWCNSIHDSFITDIQILKETIYTSSLDSTIRSWNSKRNFIFGTNTVEPILCMSSFEECLGFILFSLKIVTGGECGTVHWWDSSVNSKSLIGMHQHRDGMRIENIQMLSKKRLLYSDVLGKVYCHEHLGNTEEWSFLEEGVFKFHFEDKHQFILSKTGRVMTLDDNEFQEIFHLKKEILSFSLDSNSYLFYTKNGEMEILNHQFELKRKWNVEVKEMLNLKDNTCILATKDGSIDLLDQRTFKIQRNFIKRDSNESPVELMKKYSDHQFIITVDEEETSTMELLDLRNNKSISLHSIPKKESTNEKVPLQKRSKRKENPWRDHRIQTIYHHHQDEIIIQYAWFDARKYTKNMKTPFKGTPLLHQFEFYTLPNIDRPNHTITIRDKVESVKEDISKELLYYQSMRETSMKLMVMDGTREVYIYDLKQKYSTLYDRNTFTFTLLDPWSKVMSEISLVDYSELHIWFGFSNGVILLYSLKKRDFLEPISLGKELEGFHFQKGVKFLQFKDQVILDLKTLKEYPWKKENIITVVYKDTDSMMVIGTSDGNIFTGGEDDFHLSPFPILSIKKKEKEKRELSFKNWSNMDEFLIMDVIGNEYCLTSENRIQSKKTTTPPLEIVIRIGTNGFGIFHKEMKNIFPVKEGKKYEIGFIIYSTLAMNLDEYNDF